MNPAVDYPERQGPRRHHRGRAPQPPTGATLRHGLKDGKVRFWAPRPAARSEDPAEPAPAPSQRGVAFDPTGDLLLTGCEDGEARLWPWASGAPAGPPLVHYRPDKLPNPDWPFQAGVTAVAFGRSGRTAATGGYDGCARLWDVSTGDPVGQPLRHDATNLNALAFGPDGQTLWVADDWTVRGWDAVSGKPLGKPMRRYYVRCLACSPPTASISWRATSRTAWPRCGTWVRTRRFPLH